MNLLTLRSVTKRYTATDPPAVDGVSFECAQGEIVALIGGSGSGKTTLLRVIAGLEIPDAGEVMLNGTTLNSPTRFVPPEKRDCGLVFQDYALFPHLTAWQNACFGLARGAEQSRVKWLFELLGIQGFEQRFPHQLSGGQRQRLALARALAPSPKVVLLDEPFSSLDVEVRLRLRSELSGVLQACGASGVIVTHDPGEALAICDRVAVMRDGALHQCASPQDIVRDPATAFVGSFVLQNNVIPVQSTRQGELSCAIGSVRNQEKLEGIQRNWPEESCILVEPQSIGVIPDDDAQASVLGREFRGDFWEYRIRVGDLLLRARCPLEQKFPPHSRCRVSLKNDASVRLLPHRIDLTGSHF